MPAGTGLDQLLRRLQQDDREEDWQTLHRQQAPRLRAVVRRVVGEEALAEDALQECFLRLRDALPRYRPGSDERALGWLTVIASRSAIDLRRQLRRQLQPAVHDAVDQLAREAEHGLDDQARAAVGEALATLPERQRLSLLLHVVDGLPHKQVGEALACSERTASSTVHRGLVGLRRELHRRGYRVASVAMLLLPAAWSEASAPLATAATAGAGTAATSVAGKSLAIGGLVVLASGLLLLSKLGWPAEAVPMEVDLATPDPAAVAASTVEPDPVGGLELATEATQLIQQRPARDLAELVVPVVSLQPRHLAATSFDTLTLRAVGELGFKELWVDGRLRSRKHLPEILPRWQALAGLGYKLTLDLRAPVEPAAWQQALAKLGPQAVAAVAVYSDPEHPADAPAMVTAIRAWLAQRPAWQATPVYDLRETFDRSAHDDWTGCFRLAAAAERLEALPPLPANRPATGPVFNERGQPSRLGAAPMVVASELLVQIAEALAADAQRLYLHELLDRAAPQPELWRAGHSHGLLRADGRPRPSYRALQRLRNLLMPTGGDGDRTAPAKVDVRLQQGHTPDLRSLDLRHPDGSATVLLWRAVDRWDGQALRAATILSQEIVLHSARPCRWSVHDPLQADDARATIAAAAEQLNCHLADELLVVRIEAARR